MEMALVEGEKGVLDNGFIHVRCLSPRMSCSLHNVFKAVRAQPEMVNRRIKTFRARSSVFAVTDTYTVSFFMLQCALLHRSLTVRNLISQYQPWHLSFTNRFKLICTPPKSRHQLKEPPWFYCASNLWHIENLPLTTCIYMHIHTPPGPYTHTGVHCNISAGFLSMYVQIYACMFILYILHIYVYIYVCCRLNCTLYITYLCIT